MTQSDADVVGGLLAAAGNGVEFDSVLAKFARLGETGCDLLFAAYASSGHFPVGASNAHPRDIADDVWQAFVTAARCWPDRFLHQLRSGAVHRIGIMFLDALGEIDRPQARELLVTAVNQRQAGHAMGRQFALRSLVRLADPQVPDLLVRLVKDRDSSVRFAAVEAAIDHGDARLLPSLRQITESARTKAGTRRYALDAITAIEGRGDREQPPR